MCGRNSEKDLVHLILGSQLCFTGEEPPLCDLEGCGGRIMPPKDTYILIPRTCEEVIDNTWKRRVKEVDEIKIDNQLTWRWGNHPGL